jgi:hypothetical protein
MVNVIIIVVIIFVVVVIFAILVFVILVEITHPPLPGMHRTKVDCCLKKQECPHHRHR